MLNMEHFAADHHPEFLLARLQKLQRSYGDDLSVLNLNGLQRSAKSGFGYLTQ
jgi:hypothetical protein